MFEIIHSLSSSTNEEAALIKLLLDEDTRLKILKSMGNRLLKNSNIFLEDCLGQLTLITSIAPFAESQEECIDIAQTIKWGLKQKNILPLISEHKGKDLANRCLISLSFFYKAIKARTNHHGYPNHNFYRKIGIQTYLDIGEYNLSNHF